MSRPDGFDVCCRGRLHTGCKSSSAAGADVNLQDSDGETALMLARQRWHQDVVELIEQHIKAKQASGRKHTSLGTEGKRDPGGDQDSSGSWWLSWG